MAAFKEHLPYALRQFETDIVLPIKVFGIDLSIDTISSAKLTTGLLLAIYLVYATRECRIVPSRLQVSAEMLYGIVSSTVLRVAGPDGKATIPFVFTMFIFILFGTLLGLTPIKQTFTSSLAVTLALSLSVFGYANMLAFRRHGLKFFRFFLPSGVPMFVAPILVSVEIISYLFRPITLGFRLFANIVAGHVMLKLFADFSSMLVGAFGIGGVFASIFPVLIMIVLYAFEVMIICIQSYIFMLITTMYLRDALNGH